MQLRCECKNSKSSYFPGNNCFVATGSWKRSKRDFRPFFSFSRSNRNSPVLPMLSAWLKISLFVDSGNLTLNWASNPGNSVVAFPSAFPVPLVSVTNPRHPVSITVRHSSSVND